MVVQPVDQTESMPPLSPDPEAIDHLEGNEREIRKYREHAEAERRQATNGNGRAGD